jgi:putative tryptophan/tyrosine transport system substrate-binding protein
VNVVTGHWSVFAKRSLYLAHCALLFALSFTAEAQQPRLNHVGVITSGGLWYETIDGLRIGLRQLGLQEGKHFLLSIRETKGDRIAAEEAARALEQEKVDVIFTTQTSVTIPAKSVTSKVPIVFCAGADPVVLGLVKSMSKPEERLTGVYYRDTELMAKRLEILKEILPKIRRVVTFFDPSNPVANGSFKVAQQTGRLLGIDFVERHVTSPEGLRSSVQALRAGEVDAYFEVSDGTVNSQDQVIIDTAKAKRLPTMFINQGSVRKGGIASYGVSYKEVGRISAKYVQRILTGVRPNDLPVESVDKIELFFNLKSAKQIGLTIPPNVLARADRVIR